jgi:ComF family protein
MTCVCNETETSFPSQGSEAPPIPRRPREVGHWNNSPIARILQTNGGQSSTITVRREPRCVFRRQNDPLTLDLPPSQTMAWRAVVRVLRSPADSLATVLFPAECLLCGDPIAAITRVPVCPSCFTLPHQSHPLCGRCGENLAISDFGEGAGNFCRPCRLAPPPFERAVASGVYTGSLRGLLHLLKYERMQPLARKLGALIADEVAAIDHLPEAMQVVPVPLFAARQRQRGFNQAESLAGSVIHALRSLLPGWSGQLAPDVLKRERATESQSGLTAAERRRNVRDVFSVPDPARVAGRNILLIDDIYTTGATARACSKALRQAGAAAVWVATAARAQREPHRFTPGIAFEPAVHTDVALWDRGSTQ